MSSMSKEHNYDIGRLAGIAKIWLSEDEAADLDAAMAPLFRLAEGAAGAECRTDAECVAGDGCGAKLGYVTDGDAVAPEDGLPYILGGVSPDWPVLNKMALTVSELREDVPEQSVDTEALYGLSPADGGGFTIPRLLE